MAIVEFYLDARISLEVRLVNVIRVVVLPMLTGGHAGYVTGSCHRFHRGHSKPWVECVLYFLLLLLLGEATLYYIEVDTE